MDLHYIQNEILVELGKHDQLRFSGFGTCDNLRIEKDLFNYHLQTLVKLGLIDKAENQAYALSTEGKKYVSKIDFASKKEERLPKLSVMVQIFNRDNPELVLLAKRLKQPFFGQMGLITGKIRAGEYFDQAMQRECVEETGLVPTKYQLVGVYRWMDYEKSTQKLVHDGVFMLYKVFDYTGELQPINEENENVWTRLSDLPKDENDGTLMPTLKLLRDGYEAETRKLQMLERELVLDRF